MPQGASPSNAFPFLRLMRFRFDMLD
jgi:hypothetical protein